MKTATHTFFNTSKLVLAAGLTAALLVTGCASQPGDSVAKRGAKSGAAIGAGIGLLMGILSGDPEKAVAATALGAGLGAGQGAYEGWRQDQDDVRTRQITTAIRESSQASQDADNRKREELTRLLGVWQMSGWAQGPDGSKVNVSSQVNGNVQMNYFVELAWIDLKLEGSDARLWGTTTLGYNAGNGYEMSTRFNTLPDSIDIGGGTFDSGSRTFTWSDPEGVTTIRFQTPDRCQIETRVGGVVVESYQLTRS